MASRPLGPPWIKDTAGSLHATREGSEVLEAPIGTSALEALQTSTTPQHAGAQPQVPSLWLLRCAELSEPGTIAL